ncbi:hypothetical protein ACTA71_007025 [Dictyostelium dimigraforme]
MGLKRKIAIIGGGPAGIVSGKTAMECGYDIVIFDKNEDIGGVWSIKNGKAWDNMKTHISYISMGFSDYFWNVPEERKPFYPSREEMNDYFYNYCVHFNILDKFKLNTNVIEVTQLDDSKRWLIRWCTTTSKLNNDNYNNYDGDYKNNNINEDIFDFVIICSGFFSKKREIKIKDKLNQFNGKIWTSEQYKNPKNYINKRVLVIGGSSSGIEIASDIADVSKKVYVCSKRNSWIVKRGFPYSDLNLPIVDHCILSRDDHYKEIPDIELNIIKNKILNQITQNQRENEYYKMTIPDFKPPQLVFSDNFLDILKSGKIKVTNKSIISCNGNNVNFIDSNNYNCYYDGSDNYTKDNIETIEFDDIICCDGYDIDFSFFDDKIKEAISFDCFYPHMPILLHKHIFSPDLDNIAFVGLYKSSSMFEMEIQARWVVYCWSNLIKPPTREQMLNGISKELEIRKQNEPTDRPQFAIKSPVRYCDEIAKEIGCLPDFEQLKQTDPHLYDILWNKMFHPAAFRLVGPFSNVNAEYHIKNDFNHYFKKLNK